MEVVDRIDRKVRGAAEAVPEPETVLAGAPESNGRAADIGIITIGGCRRAALEAQHLLGRAGVDVDVLRVRGFPFHPSIAAFAEARARVFVVEQNRDAQLRTLLAAELELPIRRLESIRFYGGQPLSAPPVVSAVLERLGREQPREGTAPHLEIAGGA